MMMIAWQAELPLASDNAFPVPLSRYRSFAAPHSLRGRGYAPFSKAHSFAVPSGEGGGDDGVSVLRLVHRLVPRLVPRLALRPVFSFRIICSLIIVHSCRSRRGGGVFFHLSRPSSCQILGPLPVAHSVSFLVPSCVSLIISFSCRLALSLRSHLVPSCRIAERLAARLAVAPFYSARLSVLPMSCRPHHLIITG